MPTGLMDILLDDAGEVHKLCTWALFLASGTFIASGAEKSRTVNGTSSQRYIRQLDITLSAFVGSSLLLFLRDFRQN